MPSKPATSLATCTPTIARVAGDDVDGFIQHIRSNVHISGEFDDAQKKRLAQIVTRCPVHKTLANGVAIDDNASFD